MEVTYDTIKIAELLCEFDTKQLGYSMLEHLSDEQVFDVFRSSGKIRVDRFKVLTFALFEGTIRRPYYNGYLSVSDLIRGYSLWHIERRVEAGIPIIHTLDEDIRNIMQYYGIREL